MARLLVVLVILYLYSSCNAEWDSNGYVLYCPCMGRFGNQVAQFLGALQFAKDLNRTLALPPFRTYVRARNVPFRDWFKTEIVNSYHKSIEMEVFINEYGPTNWPSDDRPGYCYRYKDNNDCEMKKGNPFGPFWDDLNIEFTKSIDTGLSYDTYQQSLLKLWNERFPPSTHPVLAFKGAPGSFPVNKRNRHLQKYLKWSDELMDEANKYIHEIINDEPYIAVHLRIGKDWERACDHAVGVRSFMESLMCMEELSNDAVITRGICFPSTNDIINDIAAIVQDTGISNVYIGSDVEPPLKDIREGLGDNVQVHYMNPHGPQLDVVMFELSTHFIANCVSSLSAIAVRARNIIDKPSSYLGLISNNNNHDEL